MKDFHSWISDLANSIEDASTIVKDEHGNIIEKKHRDGPTYAEPVYRNFGTLSYCDRCQIAHSRRSAFCQACYDDIAGI